MIIYHNPRCSKSRQTLDLLRSHGIEPQVIEYLKQPLDKATIQTLCQLLNTPAHSLVRMKESMVKELNLKAVCQTDDDWLNAMEKHPQLIERPIVSNGKQAVIGRPPENVLQLIVSAS